MSNRLRTRRPKSRKLALEMLERRHLLAAFVVNSFGDLGDQDPNDGVAKDSNGQTTLRAVIEHINRIGGSHNITFSVSGTVGLERGLPTINPTVDINGLGGDGKRIEL